MRKILLRYSLAVIAAVVALGLYTPPAGAVVSRLTTDANDQFQPDIYGNRVVWLDGTNDPYMLGKYSNIYLYTIGGSAFKITSVKKAHMPAISSTRVVWEDLRNNIGGGPGADNTDIYGYTVPGGPESAVSTDTDPQLGPTVSGSQVVWSAFKGGQWDIWLKKTNGAVIQITNDAAIQQDARIDGDRIVWTDKRNGADDVYLYDITAGVETRITDNASNQNEPDISGNRIVWTDSRGPYRNIYVYDTSSPVANGSPVNVRAATQHSPRISGDRVVWTDWRNGDIMAGTNSDVYCRNLASGTTKRITPQSANQDSPAIFGNRIVWADNRNGNWDIYMDELDAVAPSAAVQAPRLSTFVSKTTTFKVRWSASDPAPSSGIAYYDVQYKIGSGGVWTNWKTKTPLGAANMSGVSGRTYYFRARATDGDGNVGAWSAGDKTIVPFDQDKKIFKRRGFGDVFSSASSRFFRGTLRSSSRRGDFLSYKFTGRNFSFITTKGPDRSKFKVYVDGVYKGTFCAFATKVRYRREAYAIASLAPGVHTVKILNLATTGRPRLDTDATAIGN